VGRNRSLKERIMKATDILREQHVSVRSLFKKILSTSDRDQRSSFVDWLIAQLEVHTTLEGRYFYPAIQTLRTRRTDEMVLESYEEHSLVDLILAQLPMMDQMSDRFEARVRVLQSLVEQHVAEEEEELFKQAERLGEEELDALGRKMKEEIEEIERVNELVIRARTAAERTESWAGRYLDMSLGLPRRAVSVLAPSRVLRLDQQRRWVAYIAQRLPRWMVDGLYDAVVGNGKRLAERVDRRPRLAERQEIMPQTEAA